MRSYSSIPPPPLQVGETERVKHYAIGDIHGQFEAYTRLLRRAELVDAALNWSGGDASLWLLGDFVDRGEGGSDTVELTMRLEEQAAAAGGKVQAVIGNHDLLLLAAWRFPKYRTTYGDTFYEWWQGMGGRKRDLRELDEGAFAWLRQLPALIKHESRQVDTLFLHGDCALYLELGRTVEEVNAAFLKATESPEELDRLLSAFAEHGGFEKAGQVTAEAYLKRFGVTRLVHGHTPIDKVTPQKPEEVEQAHVYHGGRCINVDGGIYRGGPGFVYEL